MTSELSVIASNLKNGRAGREVTTRLFLAWFGAQRRGPSIVQNIRKELDEAGLKTVPDFESAWIDGPISFELLASEVGNEPQASGPDTSNGYGGASQEASDDAPEMPW